MAQYFKTHEWIEESGEGKYRMGISNYACDQLGDIVFIEEKDSGEDYDSGDSLVILESVKAVGDVYAPFKAKLLATNEKLVSRPEDLKAEDWIVEIEAVEGNKLDDLDTMNGSEYEDYLHTL